VCKLIVILQDLLQMKIGHSCVTKKNSHKDQFDVGFLIWNDLPLEIKKTISG